MFLKRTNYRILVLSLFFCAVAIFIAHSIVPHHHHEGNACIEKSNKSHEDNDHDDNDDDDHHHPCESGHDNHKSGSEKCTLKELVVVHEKNFRQYFFDKKNYSSFPWLLLFSDFISSQISGTGFTLAVSSSRGDPDIFISSEYIFITQGLLRAPPLAFS